ncbi:MAG TPA: 2-hydroxyacyl-CoA dehydratase family protein [Solirubrobacteraceae bacterium]|nr:2-hydroxyacyl-CoA dehydratase family protein [Solirubrobacteraceae bacterium]
MSDASALRRRPELRCTAEISRYQRAWFAALRERVADGEPFAVLSADSPHEIYRAMDIPYVVVQWWSSLIAAKQLGPRYLSTLASAGYPDTLEQYNALPFGELLADDPGTAPWGGLPRPTILQGALSSDSMRQLYETWARRSGAAFYPLERSVDVRWKVEADWWEQLPEHWDEFLAAERLDLLTDELTGLIHSLERATGRRFDETSFAEAMRLSNEQARLNRGTRDLVARTVPAPVSAGETMPAVMIPQWHRGSGWARDAARLLNAEIRERVEEGVAAHPGERLRLMWLGRGLWSSLGLYQHFQERHDAVFVWSMYLGLAADGYLRSFDGGRDPLRALAARFVPVGEELRMPTWSSAWHLKEAKLHRIDGVVSLGEEDFFSVRRLEEAGIPVLSVRANNVDRRTWSEAELTDLVDRFIEERVWPARHERSA